jgi:hypothetical protein
VIVLYGGLSENPTQKICDKSEWPQELDGSFLIDFNASYIIYEQFNKLASGNWEDLNSDLVWNFE